MISPNVDNTLILKKEYKEYITDDDIIFFKGFNLCISFIEDNKLWDYILYGSRYYTNFAYYSTPIEYSIKIRLLKIEKRMKSSFYYF